MASQSQPRLLVDTDAFWKLALSDLLPEAASVFGCDLTECARLPALPYMLRRGRLRNALGDEEADALARVAMAMPAIDAPSGPWLERLAQISAIDPGEAQLLAIAAESDLLVVSGDKRALRALRLVEGAAEALGAKLVTLEAILLALCDLLGVSEVQRRITPLAGKDTMVDICFSPGNSAPRAALESYHRSLVTELVPLILWEPTARQES